MLTWMATLSGHSYSLREERPPTVPMKKEECHIKKEVVPPTTVSDIIAASTGNGVQEPIDELCIKDETVPPTVDCDTQVANTESKFNE